MKPVNSWGKDTFWVTNISNRDVSLGDLNISIKSMTSVDLLDKQRYPHLTLTILQNSEQSGSLFKKRDKLRHRKVPPPESKKEKIQVQLNAYIPSRQHSDLEIKQETYEELNIIDEEIMLSNITDLPTTAKSKP